MDTNSHNRIYSAEDIQNYLSGRLSPLQMNAMEKAALDDPFLAEAMEGYAAAANDDWKNELAALKETFAQKQTGARVVPFNKSKNNWWKAAAAVVIIGGAAVLSYIFFNPKKESAGIAQNKTENIPAVKTDSQTALNSVTAPIQNESTALAQTPPAKEYKTVIKDITHIPAEKLADSLFVYTPPQKQAAPAAVVPEAKADDEVVAVTKPAIPSTANALPQAGVNSNNAAEGYTKNNAAEYGYLKKKAEAAPAFRQDTKLSKTFLAQVMSADNTPLPFANISNKAENFGTYADVKGNFRLLSNDSVLTVEVRSAGFKPQVVTLRSNTQQNKIILTEDNTEFAGRTTVINSNADAAKSRVSRRAVLVKDSVLNVEPADGWDNYYTYVDNNIEVPDDILKNNIHGQVELSFDVKSNGAITNIRVNKSLCDNCDEAAIRMLQQGPQWKVKKGKKGKGKITVNF